MPTIKSLFAKSISIEFLLRACMKTEVTLTLNKRMYLVFFAKVNKLMQKFTDCDYFYELV